jgi:hypothetical protein
MHWLKIMALAAALAGCSIEGREAGGCSRSLSDAELLRIVNQFLSPRPGGRIDPAKGRIKVVREDCLNYFYFNAEPAFPGGHWGAVIDADGHVIEELRGR